jgi:hypothetical protein
MWSYYLPFELTLCEELAINRFYHTFFVNANNKWLIKTEKPKGQHD